MKKLLFAAVIIFSCLTFKNANAQLSFSVGVNIGNQPDWGPTGYDRAAYYYMPDIDGYYDVNAHQYIYLENNVWVHRGYLPARYRNYDLYHGYKVVVNDRNPWLRNNVYRTRYAGFRGRRNQSVLRDSHDARFRNHWRGGQGNNFGHGNDRGHDFGHGNNDHGHGNDNHGNDHGGHDNNGHGNDNHGGHGDDHHNH